MGVITYHRLFGMNKAKWIKTIILAFLAFVILFQEPRSWFFNLLNTGFFGITWVFPLIVSTAMALAAWDAHYNG